MSLVAAAQSSREKLYLLPYEIQRSQFFSDIEVKSTDAWPLEAIKANYAHQHGYKGAGVKVCIIDSGVDVHHPALSGAIIECRNFTAEGGVANIADSGEHGTMVATTIAGRSFAGVTGVAPESELIIAKVIDKNGSTDFDKLISAVAYCRQKAQIINLSLGGYADSVKLSALLAQVKNEGVSIIAAAGNTGDQQLVFPASDNSTTAISAVNSKLMPSFFSPHSNKIEFVAPGEKIAIVGRYGEVNYANGTSFSAAIASGAEAIRISSGSRALKARYLNLPFEIQGKGLIDLEATILSK